MKRHAILLAVTMVAAVVGGTAAWWGFPPAALAAEACGTPSGLPVYYTQATNNLGASYTAYGVKSGGAVGSNTGDQVFSLTNIECIHSSSVMDVTNTGDFDFAESGWHIQQIGIPSGDQCGTPTDSPVVMYAWRSYGSYTCKEDTSQSLSAGYSYPVSVRNLDSNPGEWQIIFNGTVNKITPMTDFTQGAGATNGERHYVSSSDNTIESAKSDFTNMQYWQDTSGSWVNWNSIQCYLGPHTEHGAYQDPAFSNQFPSGDSEVSVTLNASQC